MKAKPAFAELSVSSISSDHTPPSKATPAFPELSVSSISSDHTPPSKATPAFPELGVSAISANHTEPVKAKPTLSEVPVPVPVPLAPSSNHTAVPDLSISSISSNHTAPLQAKPALRELSISSVSSNHTPPSKAKPALPELGVSSVSSSHTPPLKAKPAFAELSVSSISSSHTLPLKAKPAFAELSVSSISSDHTPPSKATPAFPELDVSAISSSHTPPLKAKPAFAALSVSSLTSDHTAPLKAKPAFAELSISPAPSVDTEPVTPRFSELTLSLISSQSTVPVKVEMEPAKLQFSPMFSESTVPVLGESGWALGVSPVHSLATEPVAPKTGSEESATVVPVPVSFDSSNNRTADSAPGESVLSNGGGKEETGTEDDTENQIAGELRGVPSIHESTNVVRPASSASQASFATGRQTQPDADEGNSSRPAQGLMGPPPLSASALRAQQQQRGVSEQASQDSYGLRQPSSRGKQRRGTGQLSTRSSMTSFASELEERFNIHPGGDAASYGGYGYSSGTDPRMIQAITQTMIGEFLWKYTRRPVTGELSSSRHRRYFWVHPYTCTLYWSLYEPQASGKSQLKTKSVPIEAVRIVNDANPYPPGLHCQSLEVVSPGRRVRFTATTSQRHDAWFNALSYLLLRTPDGESNTGSGLNNNVTISHDGDDTIKPEDIDEFNVGLLTNPQPQGRTTSTMSSYSRSTRSVRNPPRAASTLSAAKPGTLSGSNNNNRAPSRFSSFAAAGGGKGSMTNRRGWMTTTYPERDFYDDENAIPDDALHYPGGRHDHHHHHHDHERMENVRACCDGEHAPIYVLYT